MAPFGLWLAIVVLAWCLQVWVGHAAQPALDHSLLSHTCHLPAFCQYAWVHSSTTRVMALDASERLFVYQGWLQGCGAGGLPQQFQASVRRMPLHSIHSIPNPVLPPLPAAARVKFFANEVSSLLLLLLALQSPPLLPLFQG